VKTAGFTGLMGTCMFNIPDSGPGMFSIPSGIEELFTHL
jgi:hypothetical protein